MSDIVPPPLREDLKVGKLVQQGELSFVIKEPDKQEYFHFQAAQYEFMLMFDGSNDLKRLVERFNRDSELYEYDVEDAVELYESCREFQLLTRTKSEQNAALLEKIREERKKKLLQGQGSILFLRFQLVDPNKFFDKIIDKIRFLWHPQAVKLQAIFLVCALIAVLFQGERFADDFNRVYLQAHQNSYGILSIWVIALCAIAIHECGHGLTCKYYGGEVHEMGFLLLAFQPCLYCNVNDAWLFENKWQKIYVALAGVWVELLLAGISAFVWIVVDVANPIGFIAFVLLTIGTATSLMVNLNPLLKFDGYYILTDMLEIQNLRQNAIAWFSYSLKTKVLRIEEEAPLAPSRRERRVYLIYGGLVTVYMVSILSFIALLGYGMVSAQFGFLANLAFIYLVYLLVVKITGSWRDTLLKWTKDIFWGTPVRQKITVVAAIGFVLLLIFWQPKIRIHSYGVVEAPTHIVYAPESGFVSHIGYDHQRNVVAESGQPFVILTSPELNQAQDELQGSQNMLQMQQQEASAEQERATGRRLLIERSLLDKKLQALAVQSASLEISGPEGDWVVEGMPRQSVLGRYFVSGTPIVTLVDQQRRFIDVIVDQRDVYLLKVGDSGRIRFVGVGPAIYNATIELIAPMAKLEGIEQSLVVRMGIEQMPGLQIPPTGLSGEIMIFGESMSLWRHILHPIRKILRADLWL